MIIPVYGQCDTGGELKDIPFWDYLKTKNVTIETFTTWDVLQNSVSQPWGQVSFDCDCDWGVFLTDLSPGRSVSGL